MSTLADDTHSYDKVSVKGLQVGNEDTRIQNVIEFWLISAPGEQTCQQTWDNLNKSVSRIAPAYKFHLPDLKVGTLDQLVGLSEDLSKLDSYVESVVRKASQYLGDVLQDEKDKLKENLIVNGMSLAHYVTHFQWDMAKFPVKQSLRAITDIISKQVTQIDGDLRSKSQAYNALRGNLQNMERKSTGSLLTRSLNEIVKKEDVVTDSEYLVTLIVVVPALAQKEWLAKYEKLSDMVVPRSSTLITEDSENALYTVTVFNKVVDEYRLHCRENKFIVRDYQYSDTEVEASRKELTRLSTEKKNQFGPLVRWLKVNFGEAFIAWTHVKALRVFVESVLRYGLPVNFQAVILAPHRKLQKKLRDTLNQLYGHLDGSPTTKASKSDIVDLPGLVSTADYFPYVFYKVSVDMVE